LSWLQLLIHLLSIQLGNHSSCVGDNNYSIQEGTGYILHRVSWILLCA
jgi:hypothetical protein